MPHYVIYSDIGGRGRTYREVTKEQKSGAAPLLKLHFPFDVVLITTYDLIDVLHTLLFKIYLVTPLMY